MKAGASAIGVVCAFAMSGIAWAQVQVETGQGTVVIAFKLPGEPDGEGGLIFEGDAQITSLDFAPGSVEFRGQPVDFDGTEADFIAGTYDGTAGFPVDSGPGVVDVGGACTTAGAANSTWDGTTRDVNLGPSFSANNLDLGTGESPSGAQSTDWDSPVVPELNGAVLDVNLTTDIVNVDPVNGIVDLAIDGAMLATEPPPIPVVSPLGLLLLGLGVVGAGAYVLRRRRLDEVAAA